MYSSLDRIDIVSTSKEGQRQYWQTDHRTAREIEREPALSVLFALVRLLGARSVALAEREEGAPEPVVIYSALHRPPEFLRQAIRAAGGRLSIGANLDPLPEPASNGGGSFLGRALRGLFGSGAARGATASSLDDILQRAFADLARAVAARHRVALDLEGLQAVEDAIAATGPDPEGDETEYWTAVFELGAFGGEVLRASSGGRWVQGELGTLPFVLSTRYRGGEATVNPLGKAIKRFEAGEEDSLVALVKVIRGNP